VQCVGSCGRFRRPVRDWHGNEVYSSVNHSACVHIDVINIFFTDRWSTLRKRAWKRGGIADDDLTGADIERQEKQKVDAADRQFRVRRFQTRIRTVDIMNGGDEFKSDEANNVWSGWCCCMNGVEMV
jgi:hypothetical protein